MTTSPTMTNIDDDVMEKAREIVNGLEGYGTEMIGIYDLHTDAISIAAAIQAARNEERERCAKIASSSTQYEEGRDIATAIREGK